MKLLATNGLKTCVNFLKMILNVSITDLDFWFCYYKK